MVEAKGEDKGRGLIRRAMTLSYGKSTEQRG